MRTARTLLGILFAASAALPLTLSAEDTKKQSASSSSEASSIVEVELPPELPKLPSPGTPPLFLSGTTAYPYRKIFAPEIYPLVKAELLSFPVQSQVRFGNDRGEDFAQFSASPTGASLLPNGGLEGDLETIAGFPFGSAEMLGSDRDDQLRANKILWNSEANFWTEREFSADFSVTTWKQRTLGRQFGGTVRRIYPAAIPGVSKGLQLFRELVQIDYPKSINNLGYLTFRFLGPDEDLLWVSSPALLKVRPLTGSNRSDPILRSGLTLDDLWIWSGKNELADAKVERSMVTFVPFASSDFGAVKLGGEAGCRVATFGEKDSAYGLIPKWIKEGRLAGSIISSLAVAVPRWVWRIEIAPKDPFSEYGRQVLYIDTITMLPIMKAVYDRSGHFNKIIMGVWGMVRDQSRVVPVLKLVYGYSAQSAETFLLNFSDINLCQQVASAEQVSQFDPRRMIAGQAPAIPTPVPTMAPVTEGNNDD